MKLAILNNLWADKVKLLHQNLAGNTNSEKQIRKTMKLKNLSIVTVCLFLFMACGDQVDDDIRLNQIQVIGTHNSYKKAPNVQLIEILDREQPGWSEGIMYQHRPLFEQLDLLGVRQFELDVFADPDGGLYANPAGAGLSNVEEYPGSVEMNAPGFKVLHIQDVDYRTTCLTLKSCLRDIKEWSDRNDNHIPVMIMIEAKDGSVETRNGLNFTEPVRIDETNIFNLDEEILSIFTRDHLIIPDDVRGNFDTLEEAVLKSGWPLLSESRGKILFALDNTGRHRDAYLSRSDILEGRILFVSSDPGNPSAAFIKMNDSIEDHDLIRERVKMGYLVRTRSDIPMAEAKSGDTTRRELAFESGAQYISTDFPEPANFPSEFVVRFTETENPARCNPVSASEKCHNNTLKE